MNAALARLGEDAGSSPERRTAALRPKAPADPAACQACCPPRPGPGRSRPRGGRAAQGPGRGRALTETAIPRSVPRARARGRVPRLPPPLLPASASARGLSGCASWFPVHDAAGQVFGVGLIVLNVAEPVGRGGRRPPREIRQSEERYRSLVQGGAQVVWVAAPDGSMKEDSPEWRWITGQTRSSTPGSAGWTWCTRRTGSGSSGTGGSASGPARSSTTGTGSGPRAARTGITTCARCRSSGTARSSSGSGPAPM